MCGLKDYCHHGNHGDGASDSKIPKMGSVVGILGHLASKHGHDIRDALMKLFRVSHRSLEHIFYILVIRVRKKILFTH